MTEEAATWIPVSGYPELIVRRPSAKFIHDVSTSSPPLRGVEQLAAFAAHCCYIDTDELDEEPKRKWDGPNAAMEDDFPLIKAVGLQAMIAAGLVRVVDGKAVNVDIMEVAGGN